MAKVPDFDKLPRPARVLPQCPICAETAQIHKETVVTRDVVRETYTCARCQTTWPAAAGGRTA